MKPHFQIPGYLNRWHLIPRNKWFNVYLHQFVGCDPELAHHDHPWWSMSIVLRSFYAESNSGNAKQWNYLRSRIIIRAPEAAHKIAMLAGVKNCWTLFITGPVVRDWGFWVGGKWVKHTDYLDPIQDGEMPSPKMSEITKARLMGAHVAHAGRFTRGRQ